jgi:hypothetical protein
MVLDLDIGHWTLDMTLRLTLRIVHFTFDIFDDEKHDVSIVDLLSGRHSKPPATCSNRWSGRVVRSHGSKMLKVSESPELSMSYSFTDLPSFHISFPTHSTSSIFHLLNLQYSIYSIYLIYLIYLIYSSCLSNQRPVQWSSVSQLLWELRFRRPRTSVRWSTSRTCSTSTSLGYLGWLSWLKSRESGECQLCMWWSTDDPQMSRK